MPDLFDAVAARALGLAPLLRPAPMPRFAGSGDAPPLAELDLEREITAPAADRHPVHPESPAFPRTRQVGQDGGRESTAQPASRPRPAAAPRPARDSGQPFSADGTATSQADHGPGLEEQIERVESSGQSRRSPATTSSPPRRVAGHPQVSGATPVDVPFPPPDPAATRDPTGRPEALPRTQSTRDPQTTRGDVEEQQPPVVVRRRDPDGASDRDERRGKGGRTSGPPSTPQVTVSIGHVDVRVSRPAPPPAAPRRPTRRAEPRLSLQDYLRQGPGR